MINLKSITIIAAAAVFMIACNSNQKDGKTDSLSSDSAVVDSAGNSMRTGNGTGTGTGSASGSGTGTSGTGTGPGVNSESTASPRDVPNGTGTESKKIDTGVKKGKWPTQGNPMN